MKPQGKVEVIQFIPGVPNPMIAQATLVCRDEAGVLWQFSGCYMVGDLTPYAEGQPLEIYDWTQKVRKELGWYRSDKLTNELAETLYRERITPAEAAKRIQEM
jgi:hypothetical protein